MFKNKRWIDGKVKAARHEQPKGLALIFLATKSTAEIKKDDGITNLQKKVNSSTF